MLKIKEFLLKIIIFFRRVNIYQSKKNYTKIYFKNLKLIEINSFKDVKSKKIKRYLINRNLLDRFYEKNTLIVLKKNKSFIAAGWKNSISSNWKISEINKHIFFKNKIILFDFWVLKEHRNKGYYSKMLQLIKNLNTKKKFIIYSIDTNLISVKGILKADFKLVKTISKCNDRIKII